jgi:hypothetical protein
MLLFCLPTHRFIRLAPGAYLQIPRGLSDREVATALRAALADFEKRKAKK